VKTILLGRQSCDANQIEQGPGETLKKTIKQAVGFQPSFLGMTFLAQLSLTKPLHRAFFFKKTK